MQDRFRPGGSGRQGGGPPRYPQGRRRRGGGGRRPQGNFPDYNGGPETDDFVSLGDGEPREPNPDAATLHLAYSSVYTHEGDVREELLEKWVSESEDGKRWRCWNCNHTTQRFTQLRFPTFRTVVSLCDNCGMWTVWDAWRDIANPRMFNLRRSMDEEAASSPGDSPALVPGNGTSGNGASPLEPGTTKVDDSSAEATPATSALQSSATSTMAPDEQHSSEHEAHSSTEASALPGAEDHAPADGHAATGKARAARPRRTTPKADAEDATHHADDSLASAAIHHSDDASQPSIAHQADDSPQSSVAHHVDDSPQSSVAHHVDRSPQPDAAQHSDDSPRSELTPHAEDSPTEAHPKEPPED